MSIRRRMVIAVAATATLLAGGGATALASQKPAATTRITAASTPTNTAATRATAAGARVTASAGFIWHPLHLINGWKAVQPSVYGTPSYAVSNGVLYLRGIVKTRNGLTEFAVLPPGARPAHFLPLSFLDFGGNAPGQLYIEPTGNMFDLPPGYSPPGEPSLTGISVPLSS